MSRPFVPAEFAVPTDYEGAGFRLEPLRPEHNERDFEAWTSSITHIRDTPGFEASDWPRPMSLAENLGDLERHAADFSERRGFTYSVLDGDDVIGCVYIYPSRSDQHDADVRSWVRTSRSEMDVAVWRAVSRWLDDRWPFKAVAYAGRTASGDE